MESYDDDEALRPLPILENFDCGYHSENERKPLESGRLSTLHDKDDALHHHNTATSESTVEKPSPKSKTAGKQKGKDVMIEELALNPEGNDADDRMVYKSELKKEGLNNIGTQFCKYTFRQFTKTEFEEGDVIGKRRGLEFGYPGLTCAHCAGKERRLGGRYFPSTIHTLSDTKKSLFTFYSHLLKCPDFPAKDKFKLKELYKTHKVERDTQKYGNQKKFFVVVWHRLHKDYSPLNKKEGFSKTEHNNIFNDGVYNHESNHEDGIEKLTLNNVDAYQPSYDGASSVVSSKKRDFGTHSVASQEYSNHESTPTISSRKAYSSVSHNAKRRSITGYTRDETEKVPDHETSDPYSFYNVPNMRQRRQAREKNKYSNSEEKMSSAYLRFKTLNQIQPSKRNNHDIKPEFNTSVDATLPSSSSSCFNHNQKYGVNQALHALESDFISLTNDNAPKAASCYSLPAEYGSHKWKSIYMQHDLQFEPLDNIESLSIHSPGSNIDTHESLDNIEPLPIHSSGSNIDTHESLDNIEPLPIHSSWSNMEPRHYPNVDNADSEDFSAYNDRSDSISLSSDYQQLDNFDCDNLLQQNQPISYKNPAGASHGDTLSEFGQDFDRLMTVEDPNELYQMHNDANNHESDFSDSIQSTDKVASFDVAFKEEDEIKTDMKSMNKAQLKAASMHNYKDDTSSPIVSLSELEELELGTSFSQLVLSNYCKTSMKAEEVKGMRKSLKEGFAGLSCIHCANSYKAASGGRFFPSHIKTISDTRKGLLAFAGHLYKCHGTSKKLIQKLKELQDTHEDERKKMKYGSQKAFFSLIWVRLHGELKEKM